MLVGVCGLGEALPRRGSLSRISFSTLETGLGLSSLLDPHLACQSQVFKRDSQLDSCFGEGCCKVDSMKSQRSSLAPRERGLQKESSKASLNRMYNNLEPKNIFDCRENPIYLQGLMGE